MSTKSVTTNAPTGLSITRSGGNFTFHWKIGDSDYGEGQWFRYRVNNGEASGWTKIGNSATSRTLTLGAVYEVTFWVKGKRKNYKKKSNGKETTYNPSTSSASTKSWNATVPAIKPLSYSRTSANAGTFSWAVDVSDTDTAIFSSVELQTCVSRGNDVPGAGWAASSVGASGSVAYTETFLGSNIVRWVRVRAHGPAGASDWTYEHHAYGDPSKPVLIDAGSIIEGNVIRIQALWSGFYSLSYPIDTITVQYVTAIPTTASLPAPSTGWTDALEVAANGGHDYVVVNVGDSIGADECMWVRVRAKHDDSYAYSNAIVNIAGALLAPDINATPNATTGNVAITITENTNCEAAGTVIFYRSEKRPDYDRIVAILPRGTTSTTVYIEEIKTSYPGHVDRTCFGAWAFVGSYNGLSVQAVMRSAVATDDDILARPPAWLELSESGRENCIRIKWPWSWKDANSAELSWADHDDAWESTDGPSTYAIEDQEVTSWVIANLEPGRRWYFRVRLKLEDDEDKITGPWSEMYDYDLSSIPDRPVLILSKNVVNEGEGVTARWGYNSSDNTTQSFADICLASVSNTGVITYGEIIAHTGENQSIEILEEWTTGTTYYLCLRLTSSAGRQTEWSDPVPLFIAPLLELEVTQTSLVETDGVKYLTAMPLTVTALGAGLSGQTILSIHRAEEYHVYRPDGSEFDGYAGENIAGKSQTGEDQISLAADSVTGYLDDGAKYVLTVTVVDEYGQTASVEYPFTVAWAHQAGKPSAVVKSDRWQRISVITPVAPTNYEQGDVCDIYRISADRPELIVKGAVFGRTYVDPFPAFGDFCGHRIVTRTANGDYITETNELAWFLCDSDVGDYIEDNAMVIDVAGEQIELPYNISLQNSWIKDFKRTSYLGGSVKGDWNPAVTRDLTAATVIIKGADIDRQIAMRGLAGYAGIAHIRTPDGSSLAADIQVRETMNYNSATASYSLAVKVIDPDQPEGMTYEEWKDMNPVG